LLGLDGSGVGVGLAVAAGKADAGSDGERIGEQRGVAGDAVDELEVVALGKGDGEKNELIHGEDGVGDDLLVELKGVAETLPGVDAGEIASGVGKGTHGNGG
jgi:hypothetical protein